MVLLPIVERELRVAARKRSTLWLRVAASLVAVLLGAGVFTMATSVFNSGSAALGRSLFVVLTGFSLCGVLAAGLFFTSDCLSEEKREGTLGLLFLTDLRGYDVVLGKLAATSLRAFYGLLAVFPVIAVTLVMGGVTGAQFWKTILALVNALFVSLAAGLFVSTISRQSHKAMAATLLLLAFLLALGPAIDAATATVNGAAFTPAWSVSSPGYLFVAAGAWGRTPYWPGLLVNQALAWGLLGLACVLLPGRWQERGGRAGSARDSRPPPPTGARRNRSLRRRRLLDIDPILYAASLGGWRSTLWVLTCILLALFVVAFVGSELSAWWVAWGGLSGLLVLVWYLATASQAARFFVETRGSGVLELLLATPLTEREMIRGQWRALRRMFGLPLVLCLAVQWTGSYLVQQKSWNRLAAAPVVRPMPAPASTASTNAAPAIVASNRTVVTMSPTTTTSVSVSWGGMAGPHDFISLIVSAAGTLATVANLAAVAWFGMWMGLTSKTTHLAALKVIVFVQVIPWFVISFLSGLLVPLFLVPRLFKGSLTGQTMVLYPLIVSGLATLLVLVKDAAFATWARRRLLTGLRPSVGGARLVERPATPPPLLPVAPPPLPAGERGSARKD